MPAASNGLAQPRTVVDLHLAVSTLFFWSAAFGGGVLVLQLLFGLFGLEHGDGHDVHDVHFAEDAAAGLNLFSVRTVAAGVAFFGLAGLAARPLGAALATVAALVGGFVAMVGIAAIMRSARRLESDGTVSIDRAVGTIGTVYLAIPGHRAGLGKVHLTLQNRTVELPAVTSEDSLPTGAPVLVVDVEGTGTVVVVRNPILLNEVSNVVA